MQIASLAFQAARLALYHRALQWCGVKNCVLEMMSSVSFMAYEQRCLFVDFHGTSDVDC
jgi:hypothetical protein